MGGGLALGIALLLFARTSFADEIELGKWIYLPTDGEAKGVISNATGISTDWVLNVTERTIAPHELMLGTNKFGSAYVYDEDGKIRGSRVLDLRESITTLDGTKWTITHLGISDKSDKSVIWSENTPIRKFYAPRELKEMGAAQVFNKIKLKNEAGEQEFFEYIHFDCPVLSDANAGRWGFVFNGTKSPVTLNLPSLPNLWGAFLKDCKIKDDNAFDFSNVKYIGDLQSDWAPLSLSSITISFPSVQKLAKDAFVAGNFSVMKFGTCGNTLTTVCTNACYIRQGNPEKLNGLVLGTADGCKIEKGAFKSADAYELYTVRFLGAPPELDEGIIFGRTNIFDTAGNIKYNASLKTVFFIPNAEEWDSFREDSRELTVDEKTEFSNRFPSTTSNYGLSRVSVIPADVFHTDGEQFLITMTEEERLAETDVKLAITSNIANIKVNNKPFIEDFCKSLSRVYPYGTEMTLVADIPKGYKVTEWVGAPKDAVIDGNAITFTATESVAIELRLSKDTFIFDRANKIITDGIWKIKIETYNESDHTLTFPQFAVSLVDSSITNNGVLDLRCPIVSMDNHEETWSISELNSKDFGAANSVIHFYAPTNLTKWADQVFNGTTSLKSLIIDAPDLSGQFGQWGWNFNSSDITRFEIKAPKLTSFESFSSLKDNSYEKSTFVDSNLDKWDLSGLTSLPILSLHIAGPGPSGTLRLPALKTIGSCALMNWSRLERIELGTKGDLTSVDSNILWNCSSLREIDFGESVKFECHEKAFMMNDTDPLNISEVCWSSLATPGKSLVDKILVGRTVADNGEKPVKIRVNENATGWRKMVSPVDKNNEAEKLAAAALRRSGEKVGGVYVTESGERLAWVLGFEIKKFAIIIR